MRSRLFVLSTIIPALALGAVARAQNGHGAPTGAEIARKAHATRFDPSRAGIATFQGKQMKLIPAVLDSMSAEALQAGHVVGILENGAAGDETGLPPGKYDLFVAYVDGQWRAYAESGGRVVSPAIRISPTKGPAKQRPEFQSRGWCYTVYFGWGMQVAFMAYSDAVYGTSYGWTICF